MWHRDLGPIKKGEHVLPIISFLFHTHSLSTPPWCKGCTKHFFLKEMWRLTWDCTVLSQHWIRYRGWSGSLYCCCFFFLAAVSGHFRIASHCDAANCLCLFLVAMRLGLLGETVKSKQYWVGKFWPLEIKLPPIQRCLRVCVSVR